MTTENFKILGKYIKDMSSETPNVETFLFDVSFLNFFNNLPKIIFLVNGNIIKNPMVSVAKPGNIKSIAANAIAAPDIISYAGTSFLIIPEIPDFKVFSPSYLA